MKAIATPSSFSCPTFFCQMAWPFETSYRRPARSRAPKTRTKPGTVWALASELTYNGAARRGHDVNRKAVGRVLEPGRGLSHDLRRDHHTG
jgi:hypothetical protein